MISPLCCGRNALFCSDSTPRLASFSYVSRVRPNDPDRHSILGIQNFRPLDFARQLNVSLANGWGIVRTIIDLVRDRPDGRYVLLKDPNKVSRLA